MTPAQIEIIDVQLHAWFEERGAIFSPHKTATLTSWLSLLVETGRGDGRTRQDPVWF
jgi:hypothetical protein